MSFTFSHGMTSLLSKAVEIIVTDYLHESIIFKQQRLLR